MLDPDKPLPPLRQSLEAVPIDHEGKPMFILRDLEGLTQESVAVSSGGMLIASLLDGKRTALEISSLFAKSTGTVLKQAEIMGLVGSLDKSGFLEDEAAAARRKEIVETFIQSPVRQATLMGTGYPKDTLELAKLLGGFLQDSKGPGRSLAEKPSGARPPLGLVAPHIDFARGGPSYAWSYQALSECPPPDLILAFGVAHMAPNSPWIMTRKAFETPYGLMELAGDLYDEIKAALWYDPTDDQWAHRTEHSLEFQALWLKHLWKEKAPPWVPVLCSSFERFCPDTPPSTVPTIDDALKRIAGKLKERLDRGQRVMILSAVDLAHVGPRFGDAEKLGPELEARIEAEDRKSLEHALALKPDDFYMSVVADGHWRKVCGLSALYSSLRLLKDLGASEGRLLSYAQAPDPMGGIVSFAGAIFPTKD